LFKAGKPPFQESNWALKLEALDDAGFVLRSVNTARAHRDYDDCHSIVRA
jgi:hypothetical protein